MPDYNSLSYKELKRIYYERREIVNDHIEQINKKNLLTKSQKQLSTHTPFFKSELIEKIEDLDFIIGVKKLSESIESCVNESSKSIKSCVDAFEKSGG